MKPPPVGWERASSLSLTEAAAVLSCARSQAYVMAQDGRLATFSDHLGSHRVRSADLQRLLAEREGEQGDLFSATAP